MTAVQVSWLLGSLAFGGLLAAASPLSQKAALARVGAVVAQYAGELPRLVATEALVQERVPRAGRAAGSSVTRRSVAEFAWVALPDEGDPIGFRDVIEVDGQAVGPRRSRVVELLHGSHQGTWSQARAILQEGSRHNLAPGSRNFNLPTVVLFFLLPERQERFGWKRRTDASAPVWELEFRERSQPTIIRQSDGRAVFSRGRVWVDIASGAVLRTDLALVLGRVEYTLTTRFEWVPAMNLVLPASLDERYATPDEVVTGRATYTNYRRFQTGARLVP